jgi:5-(carboxyamino)imidazole ribonucleotide synthase
MPLRGTGPTVGILGGGQLARMLALAGWPLGVRFLQLAPEAESAAGIVETITAEYTDRDALREFARRVDVITYESENIPVQTAEFLGTLVPLRPPPRALALAGDRWAEKDLFVELDIPTAPFAKVETPRDLPRALAHIGLPAVAKKRRLGYDGRGQLVCRTEEELLSAWDRLGGVPLLCEQWVPFQRELSIVGVRGAAGEIECWVPGENVHVHGILRTSLAPAPDLDEPLARTAAAYLRRLMDAMDYVGVIALEMFQHGTSLLANEIAPRVHNTGHWTIEGAATSQFENHVRAIVGWPLGSTAHHGHAAMLNIIGEAPALSDLLAVGGAHVHVYGKQPRPGRKLGHITVTADTADAARARLDELRAIVQASPVHDD